MRLVNLKCFLGQEIAVPRFVQKTFYHPDWKLGAVFWACLHSAFMGVLCDSTGCAFVCGVYHRN